MNGVGEKQMNGSAKTIEIKDEANLGIAMLIAEFGEGSYQPVAAVSSIDEAREIAANDLCGRMKHLERGGEPACPERYAVWAQGSDGSYRQVKEIMPVARQTAPPRARPVPAGLRS
jgi:hypothetical protein